MADTVAFVDTTIRDGHQSLWAERMSTGMMLPIAKNLNDAGFLAIELLSGSHIKKAVRELREDPWERIKRICALVPRHADAAHRRARQHLRLRSALHVRAVHRAHGGERHPAGAHLRARGTICRAGRYRVKVARQFGLDPIVNLIYSVSPRPHRRVLRRALPPGGDAQAVPALPQGPGRPADARAHAHAGAGRCSRTPAAFRSSCTATAPPGSARWCALEAVKLGIRIVNTGVPPLADGSALPSIYNVAHNLRALGYKPVIDEDVLRPVTEHFNIIAEREGFPLGVPAEYD